MADVYLTQRDIDYISRVVATEVPASIARTDPEEYSRMVGAVVDTITNRMASGEYPSTVTGVVNQYGQFSMINGPVPGAYGKVQNAPKASQALQSLVAGHVADISQGVEESEIDGSLNYANPNFSDAKNLTSWVNPMIEAGALKLGIGNNVHYHGIIPGDEGVGPYNLTAEGIPSGDIPVPYGPNDDPFSLSAQAQAVDGFSGLANPVSSRETVAKTDLPAAEANPTEWGVLNGVAPSLIPTMNSWAPVAAADPVNAPMDSVTAQGFLGAPPSLQASATAKPMMDLTASGLLASNPALSADAAVRGFLAPASAADGFSEVASAGPFGGDYAAPADRFGPQPAVATPQISNDDIQRGLFNVTADGQMDPSFVEGLMGPQNPVVPSAVETTSITPDALPQDQTVNVDNARFQSVTEAAPKTSRIGQLPGLTDIARIDPLSGAINPATNTTGFLEQPAAPADIASFADAMAAQRGAPTGLNSAEMQAMQGHVAYAAQKAREDAQLNSFPSLNVPATASVAGVPAVEAQATVPAIDNTITGSTTSGLLSPTPIASMKPTLTPAFSSGMLPSQPIDQVGFLNTLSPDVEIDLSGHIVPASTVAAPEMEIAEVADQPAISDTQAEIPGPATTTVADQQQTSKTAAKTPTTVAKTTQTAAKQPSFADTVKGFLNPGTSIGTTIGGFLGLPGALAGGFLGNAAYQSLQSGSQPMSINNIGSGYDAVTSIWGGGMAPGTQATASDGQQVTSMPGGSVAITNTHGVTTVFDKTGKASSYFGSGLSSNPDEDAEGQPSGGFFGGLFG